MAAIRKAIMSGSKLFRQSIIKLFKPTEKNIKYIGFIYDILTRISVFKNVER